LKSLFEKYQCPVKIDIGVNTEYVKRLRRAPGLELAQLASHQRYSPTQLSTGDMGRQHVRHMHHHTQHYYKSLLNKTLISCRPASKIKLPSFSNRRCVIA